MAKQPLAEVFGYPLGNTTAEAARYREHRLCPFNNKVPNCTKDKANDPLGVCSILDGQNRVITCPIRFREKWIIAEDAASFFFPKGAKWTTLTEVRLKDANDKSAGNIDVVLCSYDERGKVTDFGALEVQAVYISGNVRNPFEHYMKDPANRANMDWNKRPNYPGPDYLSSSRVSDTPSSSKQQAPAGTHTLHPCRAHEQQVKISSQDSKSIAQYGHPSPGSKDEACNVITTGRVCFGRSVMETPFPS
jgi:hypothetical protein